jgi:hypothetical protein
VNPDLRRPTDLANFSIGYVCETCAFRSPPGTGGRHHRGTKRQRRRGWGRTFSVWGADKIRQMCLNVEIPATPVAGSIAAATRVVTRPDSSRHPSPRFPTIRQTVPYRASIGTAMILAINAIRIWPDITFFRKIVENPLLIPPPCPKIPVTTWFSVSYREWLREGPVEATATGRSNCDAGANSPRFSRER